MKSARYDETLEHYKTKSDTDLRLEIIGMANRAMRAMECVKAATIVLKARAMGLEKRKRKRRQG